MRLDNVRALVTGGASGLGRAIVDRFVAEGAKVIVLDRSEAGLEAVTASHPGTVAGVYGDVRDLSAHQRAVDEAAASFGGLDVLVGNAGIWDYNTPLARLPDDAIDAAFDEVMGVNVKGYLLAAKAALPALLDSGGSMIFTISNAGFYPDGGGTLYTASKHAALGLVRQLAFECAPRVRVNGVAPGVIRTDLRGPASLNLEDVSLSEALGDDVMHGQLPIDRVPDPSDYSAAFVFLAAAGESAHATGSVINIDGGFAARGVGRVRGGDKLAAAAADLPESTGDNP